MYSFGFVEAGKENHTFRKKNLLKIYELMHDTLKCIILEEDLLEIVQLKK